MSNNSWRQSILDRLQERNKRENAFQEIVQMSELKKESEMKSEL